MDPPPEPVVDDFRQTLAQRVVLFDGAMGTEIYARGVFINRSYDEVNLNVGCPSPRVQTGNFGACLMAEPGRVAEAVRRVGWSWTSPWTFRYRVPDAGSAEAGGANVLNGRVAIDGGDVARHGEGCRYRSTRTSQLWHG